MKPRLFNLAAATSLLLCLACVCLWGRSVWIVDSIAWNVQWKPPGQLEGQAIGIGSWYGHFELILHYGRPGSQTTLNWRPLSLRGYAWAQNNPEWTYLGFYSAADLGFMGGGPIFINRPDGLTRHYGSPYWFLMLTTACLPALWFWQRRREKKAARRRGFEVVLQK